MCILLNGHERENNVDSTNLFNKFYTNKMKCLLLLLGSLIVPFVLAAQSVSISEPLLINRGEMHIAGGVDDPVVYIMGGVQMVDDKNGEVKVYVVQNGKLTLEGDFVQDSNGKVFAEATENYTTGKGIISFAGDTSFDKEIRTTNADYNRTTMYIAFPAVEIATQKNVLVAPVIGMDIDSLKVSSSGRLYLKSKVDKDGDDKIRLFIASLRYPLRGSETPADMSKKAPEGKIVVDMDISAYRASTRTGSALFPFATPFNNTQQTGYFAANWVHNPEPDQGTYHTSDYYGKDKYIANPLDFFKTGRAYLVFPRPEDDFADFVNQPTSLPITKTGGTTIEEYKNPYLSFDGGVYHLTPYAEQLNLDKIFDGNLTGETTKNVNILIGNSYTSALNIDSLKKMMGASTLNFISSVYIFMPGAGYQPYSMRDDAIQPIDNPEIPAMGVFMLRLNKKVSNGNLLIDRRYLSHGSLPNNMLRASGFRDEVLFTLQHVEYPRNYDLAAIGLRTSAKDVKDVIDMEKVINNSTDLPQLFSLSADDVAMSSNALSPTAESVRLCLKPNFMPGTYSLKAARQESLTTEALMLEDRKTGVITDLFANPSYTFDVETTDVTERFIVHFKTVSTSMSGGLSSTLQCYYSGSNKLTVSGVNMLDEGSSLEVTDVQGRLLYRFTLSSVFEQNFDTNLTPGVYIAKISGKRNLTVKFRR